MKLLLHSLLTGERFAGISKDCKDDADEKAKLKQGLDANTGRFTESATVAVAIAPPDLPVIVSISLPGVAISLAVIVRTLL